MTSKEKEMKRFERFIKAQNNPLTILEIVDELEDLFESTIEAVMETGLKGDDGKTPIKGVDYFTEDELNEVKASLLPKIAELKGEVKVEIEKIVSERMQQIKNGNNGEDGKTPEKGIDYFTEDDKDEIINEIIEAIPVKTVDDFIEEMKTEGKKINIEMIDGFPNYEQLKNEILNFALGVLDKRTQYLIAKVSELSQSNSVGSGIGGAIADNQIAFGSSTPNEIEGSNNLTYDGTTFFAEAEVNQKFEGSDYWFRSGIMSDIFGGGAEGGGVYMGDAEDILSATETAFVGVTDLAGRVSAISSADDTLYGQKVLLIPGLTQITSEDKATFDNTEIAQTPSSVSLQANSGTGTEGYNFSIDHPSNETTLQNVFTSTAHIKAGMDGNDKIVQGFGENSPNTGTHIGSGISISQVSVSSDYIVDTLNQDTLDGHIIACTEDAGGPIILTMPSAASCLGRIIYVTNDAVDLTSVNDSSSNLPQLVFCSFSSDYSTEGLSFDYISDSAHQTVAYKSMYTDAHGYYFARVSNSCELTATGGSFVPFVQVPVGSLSGVVNVAPGTREKKFIVVPGDETLDPTYIDLDFYNTQIPIGAVVTIMDSGTATTNNIRIDAANAIYRPGFSTTQLILTTDYSSVTLVKVASGEWQVIQRN